jgi:hypothetical protein
LGPDGQPIKSSNYKNKKEAPPALGEKYGTWGGPNVSLLNMPGGGAIQFDLNQLELPDFRQMTDHYQISSSLSVLTFLMHQLEWRIEVDDKKQKDFYMESLDNIWTPLVRAKSQAFWAGFSPNALQWDNDIVNRRVIITKIKDLLPEDSHVNWKTVDGAGTHKISVYDGIKQFGGPTIPVANSYWYPLLMQNGDYRGKKLLRTAFQPWFFSILIHLFANRYYERFGEPTPVGRAPFDDEIRFGGVEMRGNAAMELILQNLRNRSVVVLPNDKTPFGEETNIDYDYQIEYLESQMRGADFERYMTRLDEEMSLALFTPILMMRTADVGSYNLGDVHTTTYKSMLNAIAGDWKYYIDWYILRPLRDYNFGTNAQLPRISFRKMGADNEELIRDIVRALIGKGGLKPDVAQLSEMAGLTLTEAQALGTPGQQDTTQPSQADSGGTTNTESTARVHNVVAAMRDRVGEQVHNAFRRDKIRTTNIDMGFQSRFESALVQAGVPNAATETQNFYASIEIMLRDMQQMADTYTNANDFMTAFGSNVDWMVRQLVPPKDK